MVAENGIGPAGLAFCAAGIAAVSLCALSGEFVLDGGGFSVFLAGDAHRKGGNGVFLYGGTRNGSSHFPTHSMHFTFFIPVQMA